MKVLAITLTIAAVTVACSVSDQTTAVSDCRAWPAQPVGADTRMTPLPTSAPIPPWKLGKQFEHVVIVVLENQDFNAVMADPFFQDLAQRGTLFTHFIANFHPSYPNYLAMVGGKYFGTSGNEQMTLPAAERSIADLLEAKGLSWRQYAEGYPGFCDTGAGGIFDRYQRKHVPFASFASITGDPARCANIVPASEFDWTRLPNYAFYSPDMCNGGHDLCVGSQPLTTYLVDGAKTVFGNPQPRVRQAARWLESFLSPVLDNPLLLNDTLVVVTFDEASDDALNHVYTVFLGNAVAKGVALSQCASHYNVLRTVEENFSLDTLGGEDARVGALHAVFEAAGAHEKTLDLGGISP